MPNTVLIKKSAVPGAVPLAGNLVAGELAINYADGKLYFLGAGNVVTQIAGNSSMTFSGNVTAGNILTSGLVSATGNITGGNIVTSGSAGNISGTGNIIAAGNITGNYFIGNGSQLTGISAGSGNSISNGTSNVVIPTANGSIFLSDDGVPNAAVFSNGSFTMAGSFATPKTTIANSIISANVNAMLLGPVNIGEGTTITVPTTSTLSLYSDNATPYSNSSVAAYLASGTVTSNIITTGNITGGNITTTGIMSALGNITTANNFVYANSASAAKAYQTYNSATSSIDMVFL